MTEPSAASPLCMVLWMVPLVSFVWKRRMIQGGSWISKEVRTDFLKRKQRRRKRLGDILKDDLLRNQMIRQFEKGGMTPKQCETRIQELQDLAAQEVTADDIHITMDNILEAIMWRIWISFGVCLCILYFGWDDLFYLHIAVILAWIAVHELDNKINFGKFEIMSCCGTKPEFDGDEEEAEALYHV